MRVGESLPQFAKAYGKIQIQLGARCGWVSGTFKGKRGAPENVGEVRKRDSSLQPHNSAKGLAYLRGYASHKIGALEADTNASVMLTLCTSKQDEPNANHHLRWLVLRVIKPPL